MSFIVTVNGTNFPLPSSNDIDFGAAWKDWAQAVSQLVTTSLETSVKATPFGAKGDWTALNSNPTNDYQAIQNAIDATKAGGILHFPKADYYINQALVIDSSVQFQILGNGSRLILGPGATHGLKFTGGHLGLDIFKLGVLGDNVQAWTASLTYRIGQRRTNDSGKVYEVITAGAAAASGGPTGTGSDITDGSVHWKYVASSAANTDSAGFGTTLSATVVAGTGGSQLNFHGCEISRTRRGIYMAQSAAGSWYDMTIERNWIHEIYGGNSGTGYGISGEFDESRIVGNRVDQCDRHSIYVSTCNNIDILANRVSRNRTTAGLASGQYGGVEIARCRNINAMGNTIKECRYGGMSIEPWESTAPSYAFNSRGISVTANHFIDNVEADLYVGFDPTTSSLLEDIEIIGNYFKRPNVVSNTNESIRLNGGERIGIHNNRFWASVAYTGTAVIIVLGASGLPDGYLHDVSITGNKGSVTLNGGVGIFALFSDNLLATTKTFEISSNPFSMTGGSTFLTNRQLTSSTIRLYDNFLKDPSARLGPEILTSSKVKAKWKDNTLTFKVPYKTQTVNFTVGELITGTTSGATGLIDADADGGATGILTLSHVTGRFRPNELITDGLGGSATTNIVTLIYNTQTANYTVGQVLTGGTSGATATISADVDGGATGTLTVTGVTGSFQHGEIIADALGGSATLDLSPGSGALIRPTVIISNTISGIAAIPKGSDLLDISNSNVTTNTIPHVMLTGATDAGVSIDRAGIASNLIAIRLRAAVTLTQGMEVRWSIEEGGST